MTSASLHLFGVMFSGQTKQKLFFALNIAKFDIQLKKKIYIRLVATRMINGLFFKC